MLQVVPLATHYYGCRVVQRVLENATATQCWRLVREVLPNTYHLVQVRSVWVCGGGCLRVYMCMCACGCGGGWVCLCAYLHE